RMFRMAATLRSNSELSTSGCDGLVLQENGGRYRGECQPVTLSPQWSEYTLNWTVPEGVTGSELRVLVSNIRGDYEIASVLVEEWLADGWRLIGPLEPAGLQIGVRSPDADRAGTATHTLIPTSSWERHRVILNSS